MGRPHSAACDNGTHHSITPATMPDKHPSGKQVPHQQRACTNRIRPSLAGAKAIESTLSTSSVSHRSSTSTLRHHVDTGSSSVYHASTLSSSRQHSVHHVNTQYTHVNTQRTSPSTLSISRQHSVYHVNTSAHTPPTCARIGFSTAAATPGWPGLPSVTSQVAASPGSTVNSRRGDGRVSASAGSACAGPARPQGRAPPQLRCCQPPPASPSSLAAHPIPDSQFRPWAKPQPAPSTITT